MFVTYIDLNLSRMKHTYFALLLVLLGSVLLPYPRSAFSETGAFSSPSHRPVEFQVHPKMRSRVNFWIDVFTLYGENEIIFHHRMSPEVTFRIVDLSDKAAKLSEGAFAKLRKKVVKDETAKIRKALERLASGKKPTSELEKRIVREMAHLGRGTQKYRTVLKENWIRSQRGIKERYAEAVIRSGRYMHILEDIFVHEFGLPVELTRLPFVESSFDYKAYSSVGAAGIWQFMPRTARVYKMKVGSLVDERRDIHSATRGAAAYLTDAYQRLGTWPLALTSYNHGVAGVARKVKKYGTRDIVSLVERSNDQPFGFASQNFFPEFLAALEIYDNLPRYFPGVRPESPLRLSRKKLTSPVTVAHVVQELGIGKERLQSANYALSKRVWSGAYSIPKGYVLNVPHEYDTSLSSLRADPRAKARADSTSSVYGGIVYRVRRGDSLGSIARKYKTTIANLREYNQLPDDLIRVGQRLVVKPAKSPPVKARVQSTSGTATYTVKKGDTLFAIARNHRTTVSRLRSLNHMKGSSIRVGQKLSVPAFHASVPSSSPPQEVPEAPTPETPSTHIVQQGDTLSGIAKRYGVSLSVLQKINKLRGSSIRIGQRLQLDSSGSESASSSNSQEKSVSHTVRSGETLWSISRKYGVSMTYLIRKNGLSDSSIRVGQVLSIY
ncbi:MAG: LysM peptidoglycan-binding domain-containing protein [Bdellovibrionales bacterium]|nr:LysM peptidoglycan-binding domain-containing protein [Bdellovibrionales bacterium]